MGNTSPAWKFAIALLLQPGAFNTGSPRFEPCGAVHWNLALGDRTLIRMSNRRDFRIKSPASACPGLIEPGLGLARFIVLLSNRRDFSIDRWRLTRRVN